MIKKLKKTFITVTMLSVVTVLLLVVAIMNTANFLNLDSEASILLDILAENNGSFGMRDERVFPPGEPPEMPQDDGTGNTSNRNDDMQKMFDRFDRRRDMFTAETPYETRYFSVLIGSDGQVSRTNTGMIASVTEEEAGQTAAALYVQGKSSGYTGTYKYICKGADDGTLYIFLDRSRALRSAKDFLVISLLVALGAAAAILVLVFIFSGAAIKPMAESYEKQKSFITNAGHEIKTPLAVIDSCVEVIEMENGEDKWTKGIRSQVGRLTGLTKSLVELAKMDEGSAQLVMSEFSFSETAGEVLEPFAMMAERRGLKFTADIADNITLRGNMESVAQLCSIMADNALKYTPEGGEIRFSLARKGRHIVFMSENTAEDMEKGDHSELFDRFHRGDVSHSSDKPGYGIGMSMLRSIALAHGAKASAVSTDGRSLTVTVKF